MKGTCLVWAIAGSSWIFGSSDDRSSHFSESRRCCVTQARGPSVRTCGPSRDAPEAAAEKDDPVTVMWLILFMHRIHPSPTPGALLPAAQTLSSPLFPLHLHILLRTQVPHVGHNSSRSRKGRCYQKLSFHQYRLPVSPHPDIASPGIVEELG